MCYLCMKKNPFEHVDTSTVQGRRERLIFVRKIISETTNIDMCDVGWGTYERLVDEQIRLSEELKTLL